MKLAKFMFIVALVVVPLASQLHAQGVAGGSSALWLESGQGAATALTCQWTDKNSTANTWVLDSRTGAKDFGKIWVAWSPNGGSCTGPLAGFQWFAYISLDSGIGNRCLFAAPACTLNTSDAALNSGSNALSAGGYTFTDTPLPSNVLSAFNGASMNISGTDILPYDSLFSAYQALAPCGYLSSGTQYQGYGRGGWPGPGTQVTDSYGDVFNVIGWSITGTDPITGNPAAGAYTITPVGATPALVFVNTANASGLGSASITNVDRATLALIEGGLLARTADLIPQVYSASGGAAITVFHRESLSGTYNTFDRTINNNKEIYRTQEVQCPPNEPMNFTRTIGSFTSDHLRAIGTGVMIGKSSAPSGVYATTDSIGYAFWSAGNFASAVYNPGSPNTMKYLTVDGVDPLFAAYSTTTPGQIPTTNAQLANVTLQNVANGSYPIWSELRFATLNSTTTGYAQTLAGYAQAFVGATQPDFITAPNLNVERAHFGSLPFVSDAYTASQGPRVCGASSGAPESGGDAGGIVTTLQAGSDFAVLKGNYGTAACTGITNAASFGVRQ